MKQCQFCRWWRGTDRQFLADCANPATANARAEYDATCNGWTPKPQPTQIDPTAAYKQALLHGKTP